MSGPRLSQPAAIDDLVLYRLNRLLSVAGGMVIRLCEGRFGITRREWRIVALLAVHDGLLSSQVAEHAQLDRARTSRAITSLVAKKLVRRESGAADRRQARLSLTAQGLALYEALFPLARGINTELLAALPGKQVAQFEAMLQALQARADEMVAQADLPKADRRRGGRRGPAAG
ncbi:MAG: MarR family transcriptional regulator [Burkholderiales bacterium]|nr:MarR family transcriptional regulator [Burkholderiales bacterium]